MSLLGKSVDQASALQELVSQQDRLTKAAGTGSLDYASAFGGALYPRDSLVALGSIASRDFASAFGAALYPRDNLAALGSIAQDRLGALGSLAASYDRTSALTLAGATAHALRKYEADFYLPKAEELARLTNQISASQSLRQAMTSMTTPWVDAQNAMRSITSYSEIHSLSETLKGVNPFEDVVSDIWRTRLGDWRDAITYPTNAATSVVARSEFYTEIGLDANLADFPASAFIEALETTDLRRDRPTLVALYGPPVPPSDNEEEEDAFSRTNVAHDWLQRFETVLRRFIDELMTREFGSDWAKGNLPNGLYDDWQQKRAKAERAGALTQPLIAYADFTHYELIICHGKNWKLFAPIFRRPESVRESFQRLYLPRVSTMHGRMLTQEDELLLYAEIKRLMRAYDFWRRQA